MDTDIDSTPQSPRDRIVVKLAQIGVPGEYLCNFQSGLVSFLETDISRTTLLVQTILPSDEEVGAVRMMERQLREALDWLQWLMFKDEPSTVLKYLAELNVGKWGVCGAVLRNHGIAYRCLTCENDPTSAICVPCFENGNHKDHDYSTIYSGDGCCDCGVITAWKREGFCSRHKGSERIEPLQQEVQNSVGPVLDELFLYWRNKLTHSLSQQHRESDDAVVRFASQLTSTVVVVLLEFCKQSESLLSFVSIRLFSCVGLLNILLKTERFLKDSVSKKLHELLLKLLTEPLFKYEFAKAYLSYYPDVVNEVVNQSNDDALKNFAAISTFSVQIFTMPTLTLRLVKEMNLLSILFGCLEEIFVSISGEDGRIQMNRLQGLFKTTILVGEDIRFVMSHVVVPKYVLSSRLDILRTWMKLVSNVQGMNPQKRETSIHVEQELRNKHLPFMLCSKIARIHSLMANGAFSDTPPTEEGSDESTVGSTGNVNIQIPETVACLFSECLKAIELCLLGDNTFEESSYMKKEVETLHILNISHWPGITYDVSTQDISIHLPLHRLLSLLIQKALIRCYGGSTVSTTAAFNFFEHVLVGCHPLGFSGFIMEHPLRLRVFVAQVNAGMWKRNGEAAPFSCNWYRSVHWSELGVELDLFTIQCCAALAPPDLFVNRVLERFGLSSYLSLKPVLTNEYEPVLVREMLILIIQIVKERRFCGLTNAESLRRELIYKLAAGDATHSQILKSAGDLANLSGGIKDILDSVASYSCPNDVNQGMYSLRLPCWKELELYHPRWNSRDVQIAEERYARFCSVSALTAQLPRWTNSYAPFSTMARIATCEATVKIIRAALFYAAFSDKASKSRAPDSVLIPALHLLSLALDICFQLRESTDDKIPVLLLAAEEIDDGSSFGVGKLSLLSLLVKLMRLHKRENVTDCGDMSPLIESLLKKFAELDSGCMAKLREFAPELVNHELGLTADVAGSGSATDSEKSKVARQRQAAIMAKMKAEQSKFLASVNSAEDDTPSPQEAGHSAAAAVEEEAHESAEDICCLCHDSISSAPSSFLILLQRSRLCSFIERARPSWDKVEKHQVPILKTKECGSSSSASPSVRRNIQPPGTGIPYEDIRELSVETLEQDIYRSVQTRLNSNPHLLKSIVEDTNEAGECLDVLGMYVALACLSRDKGASEQINSDEVIDFELVSCRDGFGPVDCDGVYLSSCGHAVHQECLDLYIVSMKERIMRRIVFEGGRFVNLDQGEFHCPVCRGLANSALPSAHMTSTTPSLSFTPKPSFFEDDTIPLNLPQALFLIRTVADVVTSGDILASLKRVSRSNVKIGLFHRMLSTRYFPKKQDEKILVSGKRVYSSVIIWDTLLYSLISTEIAARSGRSSFTPNISVDSLFEELTSSGKFIFSLLLKAGETTRVENTVDVLQRYWGIKLFADSVCSGVSSDYRGSPGTAGILLRALKETEKEGSYIDALFWKRAADPVLAHDPFSSLMWILYCLPSHFFCSDTFISLVHIFYAVSVAQAAITYIGNPGTSEGEINDLESTDCLISDIVKMTKESSKSVENYIQSNHIDPSCNITTVILSLTMPFLRRCALLHKLLTSTTPTPFMDRDHGSSDRTSHDLNDIHELEKMFRIPTLTTVFNDEVVRSLVRRWFRHFTNEVEECRVDRVFYSTPAVPFRLMELPHLYQDLLRRYIKERCPSCKSVVDEPALCLLCGHLCSAAKSTCCRESGCVNHYNSCAAGTGVFLLIKKTSVLLKRVSRQAFWPSPYLDAFGEEDIGMQRGKPLYLNEERYAALAYMVASHGLDRNSKVLTLVR